jgi:hypothetical protein
MIEEDSVVPHALESFDQAAGPAVGAIIYAAMKRQDADLG